MKAVRILCGILFGVFSVNVLFANDIKEFCKQNIDTHTFVTNVFYDNDCIPADPCESSDAKIRTKYCINSVNDINVDWYGTYSRAYSKDEKHCMMSDTLNRNDWVSVSECANAGLKPGEWFVRFPYGTIKGESKCSGQNGLETGKYPGITQREYGRVQKKIWINDEKMLDTNPDDRGYCWCKANGLYSLMTDKTPKSSFKQNIWVYASNPGARNCEWDCANTCAQSIYGAGTAVRSAMFFGKDEHLKERNETAAQKLCYENIDDYAYVAEKDMCIPVDPCSASDAEVRRNYCVKSVNDIDVNIQGTHVRAYQQANSWQECEVGGYLVGGIWPSADCASVGLKLKDWLVRFPYGTVKGESKCSAKGGDNIDEANYHISKNKVYTNDENILNTVTGEKRYCWCKADGLYTLMSDNNPKISFNKSRWVLGYVYRAGSDHCESSCAIECGRQLKLDQYFKSTMFFSM